MFQLESFCRLATVIAICFVFNRCKKDDAASTPKIFTPIITSVSPSSGVAGDAVTVKGLYFNSEPTQNAVKFGKATAQVTQASTTELTIVIPPDAVGLDSIFVTTAGGTYRYQFATHATVSDFTPSAGSIGTRIKISGTGLNLHYTVTFKGYTLNAISSTPTELIVASAILGITDPGTPAPLTVTENFTFQSEPTKIITTTKNFSITSVSPVQVASFPGAARNWGPSGFSIGSQLFFGLGSGGTSGLLNDFWKYDSGSDTWTRVADFPGGGRVSASAFAFNGKGYVLCGTSNPSGSNVPNKDVWQYDPQLNTWKQLSNFPGAARSEALSFVLGQYVYFGTGGSKDFWRYDPANDTWVQKADFGGGSFSDCGGFAVGDLGYVTGGYGGKTPTSWSYNPSNDTWTQLQIFFNIEPLLNSGTWGHCIGFALNGIGYAAKDSYLFQLIPDVDSNHSISWVRVQSPQAVQVQLPNSQTTLYTLTTGYCLATSTNAYIWYGTAEFWKFTPPN